MDNRDVQYVYISCKSTLDLYCNKVGLDVVSLSGWFVVCVIVSVDKERNIEVSLIVDYFIFIKKNKSAIIYKKHRLKR